MPNERLLGILMELGLNEKEAKVYLAALSLGPTTILQLAHITHIKRPSVYPIIEKLQALGLVTEQIMGLKSNFVAEAPEKLELILENRKAKFKDSLPDFNKLYNLQGHHDVIKRYEGQQAVRNIYEQLLTKIKPHEDYLIIAHQDAWLKSDETYLKKFLAERARLPIRIRALYVQDETGRWYKKFEKNFNMSIKFMPPNIEAMTTNTVITPEILVIHQIVPPISAMVIENKNTIKLHQQLFELIWQSLPN